MSEKWLEVSIPCAQGELEDVCARLIANGAQGLEIEDEADFLDFLQNNRQYWDYVDEGLAARMAGVCRVKVYATDDGLGRSALAGWLAGLEDREHTVRPLAEEDWSTSWQKYYRPQPVGGRLYIVPQWLRGEPVPPGRLPVYLNPGLTFGTGSHASTQLCLEGLEAAVRPGDRVLDLGCGSGILAIAAVVLGASAAVGVDVDPKAVDVAYENAALNGIGHDRLQVTAGDVLAPGAPVPGGGKYRLVLANIVADVVIPLLAAAGRFLEPDGLFLCSGIIDMRAEEVAQALAANGLTVTARRERAGWVSFTARLPGG